MPNEHAKVVSSVYQWFTEGLVLPDGSTRRLGVARIVRRLNDLGIPSPSGKDWTNPTIIAMLRNEAYAGWVRWGYRKTVTRLVAGEVQRSNPVAKTYTLARGLHQPLVSQETYNQAQELLRANPSRPGPRQYAPANPLAGVVKCGLCGRNMVRRPYNKLGRPDTLICPYTSCPTVGSDLSVVEDAVLTAMERWLRQLEFDCREQATPSAEIATLRATLLELEKALDVVDRQTANAYDLVEQGVYSTEVFLSRSQELSRRRDELNQRVTSVTEELMRYERFDADSSQLLPKLRHVLDAYRASASAEEKNALLKSVLDHVTYTKSKRLRWNNAPGSDMEITLHPRLPHISLSD